MPRSRSRSRSPRRRRSPSPRRRRSPSPRRRRSPPRRRSPSPRRRSPTRRRSPSPRRRSPIRRRSRSRSNSPRRGGRRSRSRSPRRSPPRRRRSPSPRRRSPSPRRRPIRRRSSPSPRRRSRSKSPIKSRSPVAREAAGSRERPLVREAESTVKEDRNRGGRSAERGARDRRDSSDDRSPPGKRVKESPPYRGGRGSSPAPYNRRSPVRDTRAPGPGDLSPVKDTDHRRDRLGQPGYSEDKDYRNIGSLKDDQPKRFDQTDQTLNDRIITYGDDPVIFIPDDIITIGIERNIIGNEPADVMQPYNPEEVNISRRKDEGAKPFYQRDEFLGAVEEDYSERRVIKVVSQQRRKSPEVIRRENFEVRRDRFGSGDLDPSVTLSDRFGVGYGDTDERLRSAQLSSGRGDRDERVVLERDCGDEDLRFRMRGREKDRERFESDPNDLRHNLSKRKNIKSEGFDARRKIMEKRKSEAQGGRDRDRAERDPDNLPDFSKRPDKYKFEEWREKPEMIPKGGSYYEHDNRGEGDDGFMRRRGDRGRGFRGRGRGGYRGGGRGAGGGRDGGFSRFRKFCVECDGEGCDECYLGEEEDADSEEDMDVLIVEANNADQDRQHSSSHKQDIYDEISDDDLNKSDSNRKKKQGPFSFARDSSQERHLDFLKEMEKKEMDRAGFCYGCSKSVGHQFGDLNCPALLRHGATRITVFSDYTEPLSNYYSASMQAFGQQFTSVHQAWLWKKAVSLGMQNFAGQLKDASNAYQAEKFSRVLADDDQWNGWDARNLDVMRELLKLKALQFPKFRAELKSANKTIAAAILDTYWGTGMFSKATLQTKPDYWVGKNVLGQMLSDLRDELIEKGDSLIDPRKERNYRKRSASPSGSAKLSSHGTFDRDVCIACKETDHRPGSDKCKGRNFGEEKFTIVSLYDTNDCLSPFYPCQMTCYGLTFQSAIQAWLWKKATLLDYVKLANESIDAKSPEDAFKRALQLNESIKRRRIWNDWDNGHWHVWEEVLTMKAKQIPKFKKVLMKTAESVIGFTDVENQSWGCGLSRVEAQKTLSTFWPRSNELGKMMMNIRDALIAEEESKQSSGGAPLLCGDCNGAFHGEGQRCPAVNDGSVSVTVISFTTGDASPGSPLVVDVYRHKFISIWHAYCWKKAMSLGFKTLANKLNECRKMDKLAEVLNLAKETDSADWKEWDAQHRAEMKIIIGIAASKNPNMVRFLQKCKGEIGFASCVDFFWGTGLNRADTGRIFPSYWQGQNVYGKLLMELRDGGLQCEICGQAGHVGGDRHCQARNTGQVKLSVVENVRTTPDNYPPLSMYHLTPFSVFNQKFSSVYHAWMWKKAMMLGMVRLATQIKNMLSFDGIHRLIEQAGVIDDPALRWKDWDKDNQQFMQIILRVKSPQVSAFFTALKNTKRTVIALAGEDLTWGTGLDRYDTREILPNYWPGKNAYGTLLSSLRDTILQCKLCNKSGHVQGDNECPAFNNGDTKITLLQGSHSVLSNFHKTTVEIYGKQFPCAHQAWLWKKASDLGLHRLAHQMLCAESGHDAQSLIEETGVDQDPSFDWDHWDVDHIHDMKAVIKTKAVQNPHFRKALNTAEMYIALAKADDFWGTGLHSDGTLVTMPEYWPGKNMMGTLLMEVRDEVLKCPICHKTGHEEGSRICIALNKGEADVSTFSHQHVLSPFYYSPIEVYGMKFDYAYMAFLWKKCTDLNLNRLNAQIRVARIPEEVLKIINSFTYNMSPEVKLRWDNWDKNNHDVMRLIIKSKAEQIKHFNDDLKRSCGVLAMDTDDNYWGTGLPRDMTKSILPEYWPGKNMCGELHMEYRGELSMCKSCKQRGHEIGYKKCPALNDGQVPVTVISHHQHPLSNWFKSSLKIFNQSFMSAEQAWLWKKATVLGKEEVANKLLEVQTAGDAHKVIGEKGLLGQPAWESWDAENTKVMVEIVKKKLEQCSVFRKRLKEVEDSLACATESMFWGTGLTRVETRRTLPEFWPGKNKFAQLLSEIRRHHIIGDTPVDEDVINIK